jgi:hypothetical protein
MEETAPRGEGASHVEGSVAVVLVFHVEDVGVFAKPMLEAGVFGSGPVEVDGGHATLEDTFEQKFYDGLDSFSCTSTCVRTRKVRRNSFLA